jgi:hypothetical protein
MTAARRLHLTIPQCRSGDEVQDIMQDRVHVTMPIML